jgi:hypothetical protein
MFCLSKHLIRGVGVLILLCVFAACRSSDAPVSPQSQAQPAADADRPVPESRALLDLTATTPALRGALAQPNVAAARLLLESEGYTYVEANSLLLLHYVRDFMPAQFEATSNRPKVGTPRDRASVTRCDSVTWLAFESPAHDPANHTAVLHFSNGYRSGTVLMELDVSSDVPSVIRQGYIEDGVWHSGDVGTEAWLACMAGGFAGSIVRCSMTNCGFGQCMGIGMGASLAACTAVSLWNWMNS